MRVLAVRRGLAEATSAPHTALRLAGNLADHDSVDGCALAPNRRPLAPSVIDTAIAQAAPATIRTGVLVPLPPTSNVNWS